MSFIEHQALVVLLRVPDQTNAYRMFETLNDRGLRTSQADLIKNHLFWRSGDRFGEVQSKWSYTRGALEASEEDDITINFLRHALIVLNGPLREADVYEAVQNVSRSEQATVTFTTTLEALATLYVAATNPDHERWNGYPDAARRAIEVLNLLNIRPLRPLVLAVAAKFRPREAVLAFEFLIAVGVRLLIASSTRSGSVETPLANAAKAVYAGDIASARALKKALAALTPSDREFAGAFAIARVVQLAHGALLPAVARARARPVRRRPGTSHSTTRQSSTSSTSCHASPMATGRRSATTRSARRSTAWAT